MSVKEEMVEQLLLIKSGQAELERQENEIKAKLLNLTGFRDGEKIAIEKLGNVLRIGESQILTVSPQKAFTLFKRPEDGFKYIKIQASKLRDDFGANTVDALGNFETRSAYLKVTLSGK
jgi:hypothetical protein